MQAIKLGVLGGMGPLASAEFIRNIYERSRFEKEQQAPACTLYSDPGLPDRTEALLSGDVEPLVEGLIQALRALDSSAPERIVIACVTIHRVLDRIPEDLRRKVRSLIDVVVEDVTGFEAPALMLATTGTRHSRVFESHPHWNRVADRIVFPDAEEQAQLHDRIYRLKLGHPRRESLPWLRELAKRHRARCLIFGCTELHLLHRALEAPGYRDLGEIVLDPLLGSVEDLLDPTADAPFTPFNGLDFPADTADVIPDRQPSKEY